MNIFRRQAKDGHGKAHSFFSAQKYLLPVGPDLASWPLYHYLWHRRKVEPYIWVRPWGTLSYLLVLCCLLFGSIAFASTNNAERTTQLIAVLQSSANLHDKARACQQLGEFGTKEAVPVLAGLLSDEKLAAYARSGLENIPDPCAAEALCSALGALKGNQLIGVVNSLGAMRCEKAVEDLIKLANDPASGAVKESLSALGRISSSKSIKAVKKALEKGAEEFRGDAAAACLIAAEEQTRKGKPKDAISLYEAVLVAKVPKPYHIAAVHGNILARKDKAAPSIIKALQSDDIAVRNAALTAIREVPCEKLAKALVSEFDKAKPEMKAQIITAMIDCHNEESVMAIRKAAVCDDSQVRLSAIKAIRKIGGKDDVSALLQVLEENKNAEEVSIAVSALVEMKDRQVDEVIIHKLGIELAKSGWPLSDNSEYRIKLMQILGGRNADGAVKELIGQAAYSDKKVALAAHRTLKTTVGVNDLPQLIALVKSAKDEGVREAAEATVYSACSKDTGKGGEAVLSELKAAKEPVDKCSWMRILASMGYEKALPVIGEALKETNDDVAAAAITQLGKWPDPSPVDSLLVVLESSVKPAQRTRAVDSVTKLLVAAADKKQKDETTITGWYQRVNKAVRTTDEKRLVISGLGRVKTAGSFELLVPYLDDKDVQNEASLALVQVAPAVGQVEAVRASMEKIVSVIKNQDAVSKAQDILKTLPAGTAKASLFDGTSLSGWEGDAGVWRVADGVIIGGSMKGNKQNEFLTTAQSYSNFVLSFEYKLVGTEGFINGGVQFRSERIANPPKEMKGYQADIGSGHSGCLYDESRRGKFLARGTDEQIKRLEKPGDWNKYEIKCEGPRIQIMLNGEKTVDYTEADSAIPQTGKIGLQIHGGNKAEISFRKILMETI